jgi:hypothetical protein
MAKKLFNPTKVAMKKAPGLIVPAITRTGGAVATSFLGSKAAGISGGKFAKAVYPAMFVLGVAAEAFSAEPMIQHVAQGMQSQAGMGMAQQFLPAGLKSTLGISGMPAGLGAADQEPINWEELATRAASEEGAAVNGADDTAGDWS